MNIIARKKCDIEVENINAEHILKILHMLDINSHTRYDILDIVLISNNLKHDMYFLNF